jgi:hypothetical protein
MRTHQLTLKKREQRGRGRFGRTHENNGNLETLLPGLGNLVETGSVVHVVVDGDLSRQGVKSERRGERLQARKGQSKGGKRTVLACWIAGPSAIGSLKGTPLCFQQAPVAPNSASPSARREPA